MKSRYSLLKNPATDETDCTMLEVEKFREKLRNFEKN